MVDDDAELVFAGIGVVRYAPRDRVDLNAQEAVTSGQLLTMEEVLDEYARI